MEVWTDGSRQLLPTENGGKALFVGAAAYSVVGNLNFEFQVHGERVVVQGEMGAAAEAVIWADRTKSLTVFTGCMTLLQVVTLWTRGDFTLSVEAEKHWDILSALLEGLCARTEAGSQTLIVWVKAHAGDVGNEMADKAADRGCTSDDIKFDWPTVAHPFLIYTINTDEQLSQHGWSTKVWKHARETVGAHTRDRLQRTGTPSHTMCVGTTYPTATVVHSNKKGATDARCPDTRCPHLGPTLKKFWYSDLTRYQRVWGHVQFCWKPLFVANLKRCRPRSAGCYAGQTTLALPVLLSLLF
eukprot:3133480-Rhodomonas_salina.3